MTRQRSLRIKIGILSALVLSLAALPVLIAFAAPASTPAQAVLSALPPVDSAERAPVSPSQPKRHDRMLTPNSSLSFLPVVLYDSGGLYATSVAVSDLNGDGKPDLVLTWTNDEPNSRVYVLINNGNGAFTEDFSRLPAISGAYSAELIDTQGTGHYDLLLGGNGPPDANNPDRLPNGYFKNDGNGRFLNTPYVAFSNPAGSTGIRYGLALDFIFLNGFVYVSQVDPYYENMAVHKVKLSDLSVTTAYEHLGPYSQGCGWFAWMYPTSGGRIVSQSANVEIPLDPETCRGVSFPQ